MNRKDNWETKFFEFINERMKGPLIWGKSDCFLFAIDNIQILTGIDCDKLQADKSFRGKYRTSRGAYKLMEKLSGGGVLETFNLVVEELKLQEIKNNLFGKRGDIALYISKAEIGGNREMLGVVLNHSVLIQGKHGLIEMPLTGACKIWAI